MPCTRMYVSWFYKRLYNVRTHTFVGFIVEIFYLNNNWGSRMCARACVCGCVLHCVCVGAHFIRFMVMKIHANKMNVDSVLHVNVHLWFFGNWFKPGSFLQCSRVEELSGRERKVFTLLALLYGRIYGRMISLKYVSGAQFKHFIIHFTSHAC